MIISEPFPYEDPGQLYARLRDHEACFFLDSANHAVPDEDRNRYSYIGIDPFMMCVADHDGVQCGDVWVPSVLALDAFGLCLRHYHLETDPTLPPFQGGASGYLSYDLCVQLEDVSLPKQNTLGMPLMVMAFYDVLIAFDHRMKKAWWIANGLSAVPRPDLVAASVPSIHHPRCDDHTLLAAHARQRLRAVQAMLRADAPPIAPSLAMKPAHRSHDKARYEAMVAQTQRYIRDGDIFEANVSQHFDYAVPPGFDHQGLYQHLRQVNPAPFAAYLPWQGQHILSASPECFLSLDASGKVTTRPIKGTRPRHVDPLQDRQLGAALLASEKDRAENVMIVDLMRNDLSRVCEPHSVRVTQLCGLESFKSVHHLVSVITAQLRDDQDAIDLLRATFPGGSITGAPKIRTMEIIGELESERRGVYCGSIGYWGFDGAMLTSITIRTMVSDGRMLRYHVGGAVTLQSDLAEEYQETLDKAVALKRAIADA